MTSLYTIRQCFPKIEACHKQLGLKCRLDARRTLLIVTFAALQLFARGSAALPVAPYAIQQTDRFGPNSIPGMPVGDTVQVFAPLNSSDPLGSPMISVRAIQGGTVLTLDPIPPGNPLFPGHGYLKFIDFDTALMGPWEIIPTDSTGTGPSTFTNAISDPEFLPLAEDVSVQGTRLGVKVAWRLPNLAGFDADGLAVRVIEAVSGRHMWQSDVLPAQTTNFQVPAAVFQAGVDYVCWVNLGDAEGNYLENSSKAFSEPFRFTDVSVNGDFNLDGTVDAADYVVWRNGLGTTYNQNDYALWRTHFGTSLGPGGGSALPSAEPLSAAIPEPASFYILLIAGVAMISRRQVMVRQPAARSRCRIRKVAHLATSDRKQGGGVLSILGKTRGFYMICCQTNKFDVCQPERTRAGTRGRIATTPATSTMARSLIPREERLREKPED